MREALRRLALTKDGELRWERLEGLLREAQGSSGYDVVRALEVLSDYLLSEEAEQVRVKARKSRRRRLRVTDVQRPIMFLTT